MHTRELQGWDISCENPEGLHVLVVAKYRLSNCLADNWLLVIAIKGVCIYSNEREISLPGH